METNKKIEHVLHSMDSAVPVEPNPYLYEKVVVKLNATTAVSGTALLRPALIMLFVVALNIFTVYFYINKGKNIPSVEEDFAKEYFDNDYQFDEL